MDLHLHLTRFPWPGGPAAIGPGLVATAAAVEEAGIAAVSCMDHYFQIEAIGPPHEPMLEGYTTLPILAAHTTRARLGLLVTGVTYRHPGLLAKIVTTLDVVSGGRAELGIGAAWYEGEHAALGVAFPPVAERFERLEETLQIVRQMWSDDDGPYRGTHYQLAETLCSPPPVSSPRPRILVGGMGERKTLRLVARYADACNMFALSPDMVAAKFDVLRRHCDDAGRDYGDIAKTILYVGPALAAGDRDGFVREMERYATLGVSEVAVMPHVDRAEDWVRADGPALVAALAGLGD